MDHLDDLSKLVQSLEKENELKKLKDQLKQTKKIIDKLRMSENEADSQKPKR